MVVCLRLFETKAFVQPDMEAGIITAWSGAIVDIPSGFALCDGNNGTPDLRDKFIIGSGSTYNPGDSGGSNTHFHGVADGGHSHALSAGSDIASGGDFSHNTTSATMSAITNPASNLPVFYSLAFIMKL